MKGFRVKMFLCPLLIAPFLAWQIPAYGFDSGRFYRGNAETESVRILASQAGERVTGDAFELSPSGRVDKVSSIKTVNTDGFIGRMSDQGLGTKATRSELVLNSNTSYSHRGDGRELVRECGPSPMTAAEIEDLVGRTAQTYGIDPGLAKAIAWTESRFDRNRNSQQGARGPMQLMPATAEELGVIEICDPVANIDGGIRHLKLMLDEFQNPILAAAAYNAGAQAVYDNGGVPPFGETVRYVANVINRQMGLQVQHNKRTRGTSADTDPPSTNEMASDVIGARGSRFIKGVMQF